MKKISKNIKLIAQIMLLAAGAMMVIMGAFKGEAIKMLNKAILVCMECIGIG